MTDKKVLISQPKDKSLEAYKAWMQEMIQHLTGRTEPDGSITEEEDIQYWKNFWAARTNPKEYSIEELYDNGRKIREIAHVVGEQIYGIDAEKIKRMLIRYGWPEIPPTKIFHGTFLWATEVSSLQPDEDE